MYLCELFIIIINDTNSSWKLKATEFESLSQVETDTETVSVCILPFALLITEQKVTNEKAASL